MADSRYANAAAGDKQIPQPTPHEQLANSLGPEPVKLSPDPNDAPEVVPSNMTLHSRGDNQAQMAGWYDKGRGPAGNQYMSNPNYQTNGDGVVYPGQGAREANGSPMTGPDGSVGPTKEKPEKQAIRVLGLPVALFWLTVAVIVLGGIGLGVGLGVGLSRRDSSGSVADPSASTATPVTNADSNQKTAVTTGATTAPTTTSSTTSAASATQTFVTSGTRGISANSCDFDGSREYVNGGSKFEAFCHVDWPNGGTAAEGSGTLKDLTRFTVYTFEDCMGKCVEHNGKNPTTKCMAVTYNSNLTLTVVNQQGNCFLKDKKGKDFPGNELSACAALI